MGIRQSPAHGETLTSSAAFELRNGTGQYPKAARLGVGTTAQGMDAQTMLDYMGIVLDTEKLQDRSFTINLKLTDGDDYLLKIHHGDAPVL